MPFMNPFQFYNPNAMLPGAFSAPPYNQSMLVPPVTNVTCKNTTSVSASASVTTPTKFHSMQFESNNTDHLPGSPTSNEAANALLNLGAGSSHGL
jgi:hypothetical protein